MTVPHITITQKHYEKSWASFNAHLLGAPTAVDICNKAIEIALAEQSQPLISAEESRKLGAGNAEWRWDGGEWAVVNGLFPYFTEAQYRAIKQSEPVEPHAELKAMYEQQVKNTAAGRDGGLEDFVWETLGKDGETWYLIMDCLGKFYPQCEYRCTPKPTCQVRNEDTGELKTMTREKAKLLQAELGDTVEWSGNGSTHATVEVSLEFNLDGIYTYRKKANLVKLNGKLMTREAAIALWESKKDTCDLWMTDINHSWIQLSATTWCDVSIGNTQYELRERPLKQISWKDIPTGVGVTFCGKTHILSGASDNKAMLLDKGGRRAVQIDIAIATGDDAFKLAPADQQPWIATQKTFEKVEGLIYETKADAGFSTSPHDIAAFKVTGIAKGWELK